MRTCTSCGAPDPGHDVLDDDGSRATCALCLLAFVGSSDRRAIALTVMVTTATPTSEHAHR